MARFVARPGICAKSGVERTRRELRGPIVWPFLGPRSSSFERFMRLRMFSIREHQGALRSSGEFQKAPESLGTLQFGI
eukprot:11886999-Alexandrium_andersonii.AAC.1